jgi:hypothetical protein
MRVDLALYVRGFMDANTRFADSSLNWQRGFTATFEAVIWAASIRDHLRTAAVDYFDSCPHLEGLYFVRNLVGHVLPETGGGEPPYLTDAILSHGASLGLSVSMVPESLRLSARPGTRVVIKSPEGRASVRLSDTPEWRWRPRSEWSGKPRSPAGMDEYDDHLEGERVASTLEVVGAYLADSSF